MITWLVSAITAILALFILWRAASPEFRARAEAPKFKFLENLGIKFHDETENHQGGSR